MVYMNNGSNHTYRSFDEVRRALCAEYRLAGGWEEVRQIYHPSIPAGTLCSIAAGREPKLRHRHELGLSPLVEVPACPECGQVHLKKGCPATTKRTRRGLIDYSTKQLGWMLKNREDISQNA